MKEELARKQEMMPGRHLAWYIFQEYRIRAEDGALLDFEDLMKVELKGDNLVAFENEWDMTLGGMAEIPAENILELLYKRNLDKSQQLKETMSLYQMKITQEGGEKSYTRLREMVAAHLAKRKLD